MKNLIKKMADEKKCNGVAVHYTKYRWDGWSLVNLPVARTDKFGFGYGDRYLIEEIPPEKTLEILRCITPRRGTHPIEWKRELTAAEKEAAEFLGYRTENPCPIS